MVVWQRLRYQLMRIQMSESIFTGPGEVLLAPDIWGDIVPIHLDGRADWSVGKDAFLACTTGITRTTKSQGLGKALCKCRNFSKSVSRLMRWACSLRGRPLRVPCQWHRYGVGAELRRDHLKNAASRRGVDWYVGACQTKSSWLTRFQLTTATLSPGRRHTRSSVSMPAASSLPRIQTRVWSAGSSRTRHFFRSSF